MSETMTKDGKCSVSESLTVAEFSGQYFADTSPWHDNHVRYKLHLSLREVSGVYSHLPKYRRGNNSNFWSEPSITPYNPLFLLSILNWSYILHRLFGPAIPILVLYPRVNLFTEENYSLSLYFCIGLMWFKGIHSTSLALFRGAFIMVWSSRCKLQPDSNPSVFVPMSCVS